METITVPTGDPRNDRDLALSAAAAASAGALDLIEVARGEMPLGRNLAARETAENLADALRSVLAIEIGEPAAADLQVADMLARRAQSCGTLLAAVQEFLEDWIAE